MLPSRSTRKPRNARADDAFGRREPFLNWVFKFVPSLCALVALVSASPIGGYAQVVERLSQVRKLYVDSLGTDKGAAEMREQMVRRS